MAISNKRHAAKWTVSDERNGPCDMCGMAQPEGTDHGVWETDGPCIAYVGAVLCDREMNGYDDSDFYAIVWDAAEKRTKKIVYASTRYAGGGWCTVDATPETLAAATAYNQALAYTFALESHVKAERALVQAPVIGSDVLVIKGRKVKKGTEGRIFWRGEGSYGARVGIELADGTRVFTAQTNVQRVAVSIPNYAECERRARDYARTVSGRHEILFIAPGTAHI